MTLVVDLPEDKNLLVSMVLYKRSIAKERPRAGKGGHFYTPKRTQDFEQDLRLSVIGMLEEGYKVTAEPVMLVTSISLSVPKSWSASDRYNALIGNTYPNSGDLDNRMKAILDALNGVFYVDDIQVVSMFSQMQYGKEDKIELALYKRK